MVVALSIWLLRRRRKRAKSLDVAREMEEEFEEGTGPKQFRYGELVMATDNFSDKKKLGEGGFRVGLQRFPEGDEPSRRHQEGVQDLPPR
jgi:hypothetical protein